MLSLNKPSAETIRRFLSEQAPLPFSYAAVGATATTPPAGFVVDHTRLQLGQGKHVFQSASAALRRWDQIRLGWTESWSPETPIRSGETVAVLGRAIGLRWLSACRIVYVVDETGPMTRFGFAYGTLPGHIESGEERFLIEWDQEEGSVWYDILAFSRPNHIAAQFGHPVVRRLQKRFGRDSAASMLRAVSNVVHRP